MLRSYAGFFVQACFRLERLRFFIDRIENWEIIAEDSFLEIMTECERINFANLASQTTRILNEVKFILLMEEKNMMGVERTIFLTMSNSSCKA